MLHLIPAPLHRAGLRLADRLRRTWWRLARPRIAGVSIIAQDGNGQILLVRHSYGPNQWTLPGGAMKSREDPAGAARREFTEELGPAPADLRPLGCLEEQLHGATNLVHVFTGTMTAALQPDGREIVDARFFARNALPPRTSHRVHPRLAMLVE